MKYGDSPAGDIYGRLDQRTEEDDGPPHLEVVEDTKLDLASDVFPSAAYLRSVSGRMFGDD